MKKLVTVIAAAGLAAVSGSASAWWGSGWNDGHGLGDGYGDVDGGFSMSFSGRGHGRGYGRGYGHDYYGYGPHYGYAPYGYAPYGYAPPPVPYAPQAAPSVNDDQAQAQPQGFVPPQVAGADRFQQIEEQRKAMQAAMDERRKAMQQSMEEQQKAMQKYHEEMMQNRTAMWQNPTGVTR
ncbi:MAG: hypothetical protein JSU62_06575 [Gammaproteobacteria bacterium]|nr:MAG: hypothetical protein JSU62_06575 [Gammaproteobacteria bacterium]